MKLAEALILRKDLQQRLSMLDSRLSAVARVQEGDRSARRKPAAAAVGINGCGHQPEPAGFLWLTMTGRCLKFESSC
jgi:hypothetical protein